MFSAPARVPPNLSAPWASGVPGFLVVTGVLLIVRVLDGAFRVWLLHADLSHGKKGERLSPALVHQMAGGRQSVCVMQQI
jgi:hypothetical protein